MHTRRMLQMNSVIQLVAVVAIVIFINLLSMRHVVRVDLTEDRIHTLSNASKALMARLEKPLTVEVFFTGGLEAPYNNHERQVMDKLEELQAWSGGRMEVELTDPTGNPEAQEEAARLGIAPIQYRFRSQTRAELRQVYMGAALFYGDQQSVLPALTSVNTIEYELARTIKRLMDGKEVRRIGYLTGHGEPDLLNAQGPVEALRVQLEESAVLTPVVLGGAEGVDQELDALLVIGPQRPISQREQYQLDQYLMNGGSLAIFVSNYQPDLRAMQSRVLDHRLEDLLGHYGIQLNRDLILDRTSNGKLPVPVRRGRFMMQLPVNHPLIPTTTSLSSSSLAVKNLDVVTLPFASSITLTPNPSNELQTEVLVKSSEHASRSRLVQQIDPDSLAIGLPDEEAGTFDMVVSARGSFTSFFANQDIPDLQPEDNPADTVRISAPTRIVVGGSTHFVANNQTFVLNILDWLAEDTALIDIRSKTMQVAAFEPLDAKEVRTLKLANLLGPSLLVCLLSGFRLLRRRRSASVPR
ncbi:MAG: GldG family protein [Myxococcota bacterium]|nr:GldG family protein [Myxococcota bacterium]